MRPVHSGKEEEEAALLEQLPYSCNGSGEGFMALLLLLETAVDCGPEGERSREGEGKRKKRAFQWNLINATWKLANQI